MRPQQILENLKDRIEYLETKITQFECEHNIEIGDAREYRDHDMRKVYYVTCSKCGRIL